MMLGRAEARELRERVRRAVLDELARGTHEEAAEAGALAAERAVSGLAVEARLPDVERLLSEALADGTWQLGCGVRVSRLNEALELVKSMNERQR